MVPSERFIDGVVGGIRGFVRRHGSTRIKGVGIIERKIGDQRRWKLGRKKDGGLSSLVSAALMSDAHCHIHVLSQMLIIV